MKATTVLFMCLIVPSALFAQVSASGLSQAQGLGKSVYGLGASVGWTSGIGISFRTHFPSKSSVQGIFGIIKTTDQLYLSIGGTYQYDLVRGPMSRFYTAAGFGYYYRGHRDNEVKGPFRIGAGIGGELKIQDAFHVNIEGMFTFFSDSRVIPLPQLGCHYYFN